MGVLSKGTFQNQRGNFETAEPVSGASRSSGQGKVSKSTLELKQLNKPPELVGVLSDETF